MNSQNNQETRTVSKTMLDVLTDSYAARQRPLKATLQELKTDRDGKEGPLLNLHLTLFGKAVLHDPGKKMWKKVMGKVVEYAFLILVACGEFPFNKVSFQILGLSTIATNRVAILIGIIMAGLAGAIGYALNKRWVTEVKKYLWIALPLIVVSFSGIYALSILREKFLAFNTDGLLSLPPVVQTVFTFMIFIAGIAATFFGEGMIKDPELFKAYCKSYADYELILDKITAKELEIEKLDDELQQRLKDEGETMLGQERLRISRGEGGPKVPLPPPVQQKAKPIITMDGLVKEFRSQEEKEALPWKTPFRKAFIAWLEKSASIETELERKKINPSFAPSFLPARIKILRDETVILESMFTDESPSVKGIWNLSKEVFSHLQNRVENES